MPTPTTVSLSRTHLRVTRGADEIHHRPLPAGGTDPLGAATEQYRKKAPYSERPIGESLFRWLDGPGGWLTTLVRGRPDELWLEFALEPEPEPEPGEAAAFLEAPWELLAEGDDFLAARLGLTFSVVRRYAPPVPPPEPGEYRPAVAFMAADPRDNTVRLDYEAEELAILKAVGVNRVDFLCEDTGHLTALLDRIKAETEGEAGVDVIHLSCHGSAGDRPVLALEDEYGDAERVGAKEIADRFGVLRPRLLFVSACETAEPDRLLGSLAGELARRGFPAVVGWAGSVRDVAATRFAADLYQFLADRAPLEKAVAEARSRLVNDPDPAVRAEWHKARVYFGAAGGGPVCAGQRRRHMHDADRAEKEFLDKEKKVPVATRRLFVGRRRHLQDVLRLLRSRQPTVVHGLGQHGKSSLAARIASRFPSHDLVVVFGDYTPRAVLRAIDSVLADEGHAGAVEARKIIAAQIAQVNDSPGEFRQALGQLLKGPLSELRTDRGADRGKATHRPILLVVDDFEQALLDLEAGGPHRVRPELAPGLAVLFRAFDRPEHQSRLLITSRFRFSCADGDGREATGRLAYYQLPDMSASDLQRQGRQLALQSVEGMRDRGALRTPAEVKAREANLIRLLAGVTDLVFGSPRLMSYAARLLAESETAFAGFYRAAEEYRRQGRTTDQKLVDVLNHIAVEKLIGFLSPEERELLRRSCLFQIPAPVSVLHLLDPRHDSDPEPAGAAAARLFGLGLWNRFENPLNHRAGHDHALIDPLARPILDPGGVP
jgi:hypothetical protein